MQSFLYVYSEYNQIWMHQRNKEKTFFMINCANLYYKVMSFSLKNVKATYQRLIGKIFKRMLSQNIKVYVDDIVVKSNSCVQHVEYFQKVFKALRNHGMRLSPEKCAFGVECILRIHANTLWHRSQSRTM